MAVPAHLEPLVIVGLAFRFPGDVNSPEEFWNLLQEKRCAATEVPTSRMNINGFYRPCDNRVDSLSMRGGNFLREDLGVFDAPFFSISCAEAAAMDPQQRGLLETAYHALENAGIPIEAVDGSDTAVFTGSFGDDHKILSLKDPERLSPYTGSSTAFSVLANRLSWWFNLKGPSVHVDTACSSSLVGLHLACQSLRNQDCSMALVCGCNVLSSVEQYLLMSNLSMLSSCSRSYSFDHRANGYARGEGFGAIVVKRLSDAVANGDCIRAVIRATGTNQDGRTPSLTMPSQQAQEDLIRNTYSKAGLALSTTAFVEAHGTGTAISDPIEARALASVFGAERSSENPLYIGSVKSNIGHLEGGSGIAGLIKTVLALERGVIPANANFEKPNPNIDTKGLKIAFPSESRTWPTVGLRRASINSFGFGGSNAHVVLDDSYNFLKLGGIRGHHLSVDMDNRIDCLYPSSRPQLRAELLGLGGVNNDLPRLLVWSASDNSASMRVLEAYSSFFASSRNMLDSSYLDELAFMLTARRSLLPSRVFAVVSSVSQLSSLSMIASQPVRSGESRRLGFIFTGQGAQYSRMGEKLLTYPTFKASIELSEQYLRLQGCKWSLRDELARPEEETRIHDPEYSQPICTALQIALVDLMAGFGVNPQVVVGHSSGEIAAGYATGGLAHESAIKVAYFRGQVAASLATSSETKGAMLVAGLSEAEASRYLADFRKTNPLSTIVVACINSPSAVTLAGDETAIDGLKAQLGHNGTFARKLRVSVAYHSPHVSQISDRYRDLMGSLRPRPLQRDIYPVMISSVTGLPLATAQLRDPEYWTRNMELPVRFSEAVSTAMLTPFNKTVSGDLMSAGLEPIDVIEIGPHSTLQSPFKDITSHPDSQVPVHYGSVLHRGSGAVQSLLRCLGQLHCLGHQIDLFSVNTLADRDRGDIKHLSNLPPYPFDHSRSYWHESRQSREFRLKEKPRSDFLGSPVTSNGPPQMAKRWRKITRITETPWIADHVVNGAAIYPAAGMISMAIEAAHEYSDKTREIHGFCIKEAHFLRPLQMSNDDEGVESYFELSPWGWSGKSVSTASFTLCSMEGETWIENCRGIVLVQYEEQTRDLGRTEEDLRLFVPRQHIDETSIYESFSSMGIEFGPTFRSLTQVVAGSDSQARAKVNVSQLSAYGNNEVQDHIIHPITLDGIFQVMLVALTQGCIQSYPTVVPTSVEDLWIAGAGAAYPTVLSLEVAAKVKQLSGINTISTASATDESGKIILGISSLSTTFIDSMSRAQGSETDQICSHVAWKPDIDLLTFDNAADLAQVVSKPQDGEKHFEELSALWFHRCERALSLMDPVKMSSTRPCIHHYAAWMKAFVAEFQADPKKVTRWTGTLAEEGLVARLSAKVSGASIHGKGLQLIAENLLAILHGEMDPLELVFKSDFAEQYYRYANTRTEPALRSVLELIAFKHPGLKVLEVGAGTGSTTELVLKYATLQGEGGDGMSLIESYEFTDVSTAFFSPAREKLEAYSSLLKFSVLDISKDPMAQGFLGNHYDLVVAANVLHATPDLDATLSNVRRLLRPGGKLVLLEITDNQWVPQVIFGTLPGWWLSNDSYRKSGPCISAPSWNEPLCRNGFSGTDMVLYDSPDPRSRICSLFITSAIEANPSVRSWPNIVILLGPDSTRDAAIANAIKPMLGLLSTDTSTVEILPLANAQNYCFNRKFCICLLELTKPLLRSIQAEEFAVVQRIVSDSHGVLWVRAQSDTIPELQMSDGFMRVVRSENVGRRYVTLSAATTNSVERAADKIVRVLTHSLDQPSNEIEEDFREIDGRLSISRGKPATNVNNYIQSANRGQCMYSFDPNATYVIAGGFGGVARSICRWMAKRGARHLLLLSRSGPRSPAAQDLLAELKTQDVHVECPTCDISCYSDLHRCLDACLLDLPPIKGCFQGALVLQDSFFDTMTHAQWTTALGTRVTGTQNLFDLLPETSFLILLSSVNGIIGNPSQANYAATNTYLDAFAQCHSTPTRPIISIDLGWVDFAGTVAESESFQRWLASLPFLAPISERETELLLEYVCDPARHKWGVEKQIITGIKSSGLVKSTGLDISNRAFWRILSFTGQRSTQGDDARSFRFVDEVSVSSQLSDASSVAEAARIALQAITEKLAAGFGVEQDAIKLDKPLHESGVDSLMAVRLRSWFRGEIGADVSVFEIMGNQTLRKLSMLAAERSKWVGIEVA